MAKKTIDIGALSKAQQEAIKKQIDEAKTAGQGAEAARAKEAVDFYYDVQEELEAVMIEKLTAKPKKGGGTEPSKLAMKAAGENGWSTNKILKIIANLPSKMPETDAGYITASEVALAPSPCAKYKYFSILFCFFVNNLFSFLSLRFMDYGLGLIC